jgi:hypothetical protein
VGADASQHAGQGQILHDDLQRFLVFALAHHLDVSLNVEAGRAGQAAGGLVGLLDGKGTGNGLGVALVSGLAVVEPLVVFVGQGNRADFGTIPAGRALGRINKTGAFVNGDVEVTFGSLDVFDFCARDQVYIQMPAELDQFRGDNSHGTVVGGKGLVQFTHHPADGR